jgi:perosamine synthetase
MNPEIQLNQILTGFKSSKEKKLYLHEPFLKPNYIRNLESCIINNEISAAGSFVSKFEIGIAKVCEKDFAISLNSGTSALHLALIALGIKQGDEVFIPNLTFVATANAVKYCGATPHFVEIEAETFGIDVDKLEDYITKSCVYKSNILTNRETGNRITAIIGVYVFGKTYDTKRVSMLAKKYSLIYIEDAAGALGTKTKNRSVGYEADAIIFSFNGNKIISTGNGGMVLTNNETIKKRIEHLKTTAKIKSITQFSHDDIGYNYRLSNINAAIGYAQLEDLDEIILKKRNIMRDYKEVFQGNDNFTFIYRSDYEESNNWLNSIMLSRSILSYKETIIQSLDDNGIEIRPAWNLLSTLKPFLTCPAMDTPVGKDIQERIINLPSGSGVKIAR